MGLNQTCKLLHGKGNHKQNEKITYRLAENIGKQWLIVKLHQDINFGKECFCIHHNYTYRGVKIM